MLRNIKNFLADERGQASTEYAVIIGVVAVALIAVLVAFKDQLKGIFEAAESELAGKVPGVPSGSE
ncbi:MAG: Flp family type IVb pilin [Clostridia bacterium]|jgi:pilus assembly protein Flp/PilA|nr:Flp family type IVb pilin [Clostridiales bacterium]HZX47358.1 Flp family type IVb pilin [Clostridia bacterium]